MPKFDGSRNNPLGPSALVDRATYGDLPEGLGEVVTAHRLALSDIHADLRQPRRIIPFEVRGDWDGTSDDLSTVLANWHALVEAKLAVTLDLPKLLEGTASLPVLDALGSDEPSTTEYLELVKLAMTIRFEGLRDPVEVYRVGDGYRLLDGERRWMAHHLLKQHVSAQYDHLNATVKPAPDVWAQATKNGARRPLNAVSMARQIALLVMAMYEGDNGVAFTSYEETVLPGEIDRKYYAQVARGDLYRIKDGFLARVLAVTGLKSKDQVAQYRAILRVDDALWVKADAQNWTEGAIREYVQTASKLKQIEDEQAAAHAESQKQTTEPQRLTTVSQLTDDLHAQDAPAHGFVVGDEVILLLAGKPPKDGVVYRITDVDSGLVGVNADGEKSRFPASTVQRIELSTPLTARQMHDLNTLRRGQFPSIPPGPATPTPAKPTGLSTAEYATLDAAHRVLTSPNRRDNGWFPQSTYQLIGNKHLLDLGYLEKSERDVPGGKGMCVRITREGCRAIQRPYVDHDAPGDALHSGDAPATEGVRPRFPRGSTVFHTSNQHVGTVTGHWQSSTRNDDGSTSEVIYAKVTLINGAVIEGGVSWNEADLRPATDAELRHALHAPPTLRDAGTVRPDADEDDDHATTLQGDEGTQTAHQPDGAHGTAGAALAHRALADETAALLKSWTNPDLASILSLLTHLAANEPKAKMRLVELQRLSRADLRTLVGRSHAAPGFWQKYLTEVEHEIVQLIGAQIVKALNDYVLHLRTLGAEMEEA